MRDALPWRRAAIAQPTATESPCPSEPHVASTNGPIRSEALFTSVEPSVT